MVTGEVGKNQILDLIWHRKRTFIYINTERRKGIYYSSQDLSGDRRERSFSCSLFEVVTVVVGSVIEMI